MEPLEGSYPEPKFTRCFWLWQLLRKQKLTRREFRYIARAIGLSGRTSQPGPSHSPRCIDLTFSMMRNCFSSYGLIETSAVSLADSLPSKISRSLHRSWSSTQKSKASSRRFLASLLVAMVSTVYSRSISLSIAVQALVTALLADAILAQILHLSFQSTVSLTSAMMWPGRRLTWETPLFLA